MLHPVNFSIPEEKVLNGITKKNKLLSFSIPRVGGKKYTFETESEYYAEYQESLFAKTKKKSGWDCMRHYEILANGTIPYFPDIINCPKNTMKIFPKNLIIHGNHLYKKLKKKTLSTLSDNELRKCNILANKLLKYTRCHLTTKKTAEYILEKSGHRNISSILYLSGNIKSDYLRDLTAHGFKKLFGDKCHDFPKILQIYKCYRSSKQYGKLWGRGFTYSKILENNLHNDNLDVTIKKDILNKKYDIVIYGNHHRGLPFYGLVSKIYKPNEIIMLCGEDIHRCKKNEIDYVNKGHHVFIRELN